MKPGSANVDVRSDRPITPLVWILLLAAPFVAFPPDFVPRALLDGGDDLLANMPELVYSARRLLEGEVLWTRSLFMGYPLLGEPEFATLYLPRLLLLAGPPAVVYALYLVLHYVGAELGAYFFLKSFGVSRLAALFGALSYAYSGFMLGHRAHAMYVCAGAWAPLTLLLFDRARDRGGRRSYLLAALAFAQVPLCGAVQLTVYLAGVLFFTRAFLALSERSVRQMTTCLAALVPAFLIASLQILPARHLAEQLATHLRADYATLVEHSFPPALAPTFALPLPPRYAELYSRVGVVALCAAVLSLVGIRSAPARVRLWGLVVLVAFVLMLGGYVPLVARALHHLPLIGVLRGPARHNFELALGLSVLSAWGFDLARSGTRKPALPSALLGVVFVALTVLVLRAARAGRLDDVSSDVLGAVTPRVAVATAAVFAIWMVASSRRSTVRLAWMALALMPVFETAWAMRVEARPNRSAVGIIEAARKTLDELPRPARLLGIPFHRGSVDAFCGNSVLFHPSAEALQGYVSIVPRDIRAMLDLDMYGYPRSYYELALSTLPSLFGTTHVVLPSLACGTERFALARGGASCVAAFDPAAGAPEPWDIGGTSRCEWRLQHPARYRLRAAVLAPAGGEAQGTLAFGGPPDWQPRYALRLATSDALEEPATAVVRLGEGEAWGVLSFSNQSKSAIEVSGAGLYLDRDVTVASVDEDGPAERRLLSAEDTAEGLVLSPGEGEARAERQVHWPHAARRFVRSATLELEARATSGPTEDVVLDLYAAPHYDPDAAQLVVPAGSIGGAWKRFESSLSLAGVPEDFLLRLFVLRGASVQVRNARLATRIEEAVAVLPLARDPGRPGVVQTQGRTEVSPGVRWGDALHVPLRLFDLRLRAEASPGSTEPVVFGMDGPPRFELPRQWSVPASALSDGALHRVAALPPDQTELSLFVRSAESTGIRLGELTAKDACTLRGYQNPTRLANGLFLYENPHSLPGAYTVSRTEVSADPEQTRRLLLDFEAADLGGKAVVSTDPGPLYPGVIERSSSGARRVDLVVRGEGGKTLLVVNQRFDEDWRATLDGAPVPLIRANGLVQGVIVPEGRHAVRLEYRTPRAVWAGVLLAALGVVIALVVPGFFRKVEA